MLLVDADVMIDILRRHLPASAWARSLGSETVAMSGFVAMELLQGCRNAAEQQHLEADLRAFEMYWPSIDDCVRAYRDYARLHLSHGLEILDALTAATAIGMSVSLATFNAKHYGMIPELNMIEPYKR